MNNSLLNKKQLSSYLGMSIGKIDNLMKDDKIDYYKQVCIYAFNKYQLKKFALKNKKSLVEKIEDIEILRFFEYGIKIKMVKLTSNSVAVDEISDVKKAEKILKKNIRKL